MSPMVNAQRLVCPVDYLLRTMSCFVSVTGVAGVCKGLQQSLKKSSHSDPLLGYLSSLGVNTTAFSVTEAFVAGAYTVCQMKVS